MKRILLSALLAATWSCASSPGSGGDAAPDGGTDGHVDGADGVDARRDGAVDGTPVGDDAEPDAIVDGGPYPDVEVDAAPGDCTPGQTRDCGNCGTSTCTAQGTWGPCEGQGVCSPGDVQQGGPCGNCGHYEQTCTRQCQWGPAQCVGQGCAPGSTRSCNGCGVQECNSSCSWGPCVRARDYCEGSHYEWCNAQAQCVAETPTLDDYWNGRARWKFLRKLTPANTGWSGSYMAGVHIEAANGVWYMFSRSYHSVPAGVDCGPLGTTALGTVVRVSTDEGQTWSAPVNIIVPQAGKAWECAATDGDAWYDAAGNTWHYLFQCYSRTHVWNGCHLLRQAQDPVGPFVETHANPVVSGGQLWRAICDSGSDDCVQIPGGTQRVFDEGTFDIFAHSGGWYFVSFHGYDGLRGYRGIAKTSDFVNWVAGDPSQGLPADAVFDAHDSDTWREAWSSGSIGGGAGRIYREGNFYYLLVEAADVNLGCTPGQHWDLGLLRTTSLTNASWDQFPAGNPIVYSSLWPEDPSNPSLPMRCNVQYPGFFKDPDTGIWYFHYSRISQDPNTAGMYFYQLVPNRNLLENGDLWRCDATGWHIFPSGPTNLAVYRFPNRASDGNCYLATNCGQDPCEAGQSIYQDVDLSGKNVSRISFGAKIASEPNAPEGDLHIVIHELDANWQILATHQIPVHATRTYQEFRAEADVSPQARILRFQLYLSSGNTTFRMDEAFVRVVAP